MNPVACHREHIARFYASHGFPIERTSRRPQMQQTDLLRCRLYPAQFCEETNRHAQHASHADQPHTPRIAGTSETSRSVASQVTHCIEINFPANTPSWESGCAASFRTSTLLSWQ